MMRATRLVMLVLAIAYLLIYASLVFVVWLTFVADALWKWMRV
jgi:hypothetical protein